MATVGTVIIDVKADTAKLVSGMDRAEKSVKKSVNNLKNNIIGIGAAFLSIQTVIKTLDIGKEFTATSMEFEKFETVLRTIEGSSSKAKDAMAWITDFTKSTPYELANVTDSFVKLKSYGIDPTDGTLRTLGDTASAMGKSLNQAVEAMADAVTGENERLKEFGIKASKEGEKITYNWTSASGEMKTKVIDNNSKIIQSTLEAIFNSKYVGAMEAQSKTLEGMISNINDSYTIFQKNVMENGIYDYVKALAKVFGEELSTAFDTTSKNIAPFANSIIDGINSIIRAVGFMKDSLTGIQLVTTSIELGFFYMTKGITIGIDYVIDAMNAVLDSYNSLPDFMRGDKAELFENLGTSAINEKIDQTSKKFYELGEAINSGRNYADSFIAKTSNAFKSFSTTVKEDGSSSTNKKDYGDKKLSSPTNKDVQASLNVWSDYYRGIGDLQTAWLASKERVDAHENAVLLGLKDADYDAYIKRYKTEFIDKVEDSTKNIEYVFTNAFKGMEDSLVDFVKTGKLDFSSLVDSILEDMLRLQIQQSISQPLMNAIGTGGSNVFSSIGSYFFEDGGIMTSSGKMPLKTYSTGGIADSAQVAIYGEGSMNEAFVPLPDGKTIPVTMNGGGGSNVIVNIENNTDTAVTQDNVTTSFDGGTMIVNVVLDAITRNKGGMRDSIRGVR